MKAFLWSDLREISTYYHSGGSILIISYTVENARKLEHTDDDRCTYLIPPCDIKEIQTKEPDEIFYAPEHIDSKVYYFVNAGCC